MKIDGLEKINRQIEEKDDALAPGRVAAALDKEAGFLNFRLKHKPDDVNALDYTVIEALHKQIPKEAVKSGEIGMVYVCPECNFVVGHEGTQNKYCVKCGQRIQW